jgi:hypothetical protein
VFIKPASGIEQVYFAQVLENVVEVTDNRGKRRKRDKQPVKRSWFANERPAVRYFSVANLRSGNGVAYDYDAKADKCVSVTAIYGLVKEKVRTNPTVEADGLLLQSFEIEQEEIDRLECVINDQLQPEQAIPSDSGSESGDEETLALMRKKSEQRAKRFTADHDPGLFIAGKRDS